MSKYAAILQEEDPRIAKMFDVASEAESLNSLLLDDPYPSFMRLLKAGAVQKGSLAELMGYKRSDGGPFHHHMENETIYTAFSFKANFEAFTDNDTYSSNAYYTAGFPQTLGETILNKSGLEHRQMRGPIQPLFTRHMAETWWTESIIQETVDILIAKIEKKGRADLFLEICARMPMHVMAASLGLEPEDYIPCRVAVCDILSETVTPEERAKGIADSERLIKKTIEARRREPQDDLISKLIAAISEENGRSRQYSDDEIVALCRLGILAGGGTTWRQLGITLFALLNNPDQFEAVKADRTLVDQAIIESTRWHTTDQVFPRRVECDATLSGVAIPKGALLHLCIGAANRDPSRWENPDKYDIYRPVQRNLAFGGGAHSCIGQHVSRQEMKVALNAIIDRLPNVRWDPAQPHPKIIGGLFQRGPSSIPVVYG